LTESLRIEPPGGFIMRVCTKDYTLEDGRVIKKGEMVTIPNYSYQIDPQYYPDPLTYNPDR
jgi:cytochrome P450